MKLERFFCSRQQKKNPGPDTDPGGHPEARYGGGFAVSNLSQFSVPVLTVILVAFICGVRGGSEYYRFK